MEWHIFTLIRRRNIDKHTNHPSQLIIFVVSLSVYRRLMSRLMAQIPHRCPFSDREHDWWRDFHRWTDCPKTTTKCGRINIVSDTYKWISIRNDCDTGLLKRQLHNDYILAHKISLELWRNTISYTYLYLVQQYVLLSFCSESYPWLGYVTFRRYAEPYAEDMPV